MSAENVITRYASFETLRSEFGDPEEGARLGESERGELSRLRDPGRREAWLWGRIVSKNLLREQNAIGSDNVEILTLDTDRKGSRPRVMIDGNEVAVSLSISHSQRAVLIALSRTGRVGADLVDMQDFVPHSMLPWFTANERRNIETLSPRDIATVWAVKEAVYKAFNEGEPFAPKRIDVHLCNQEVGDVQYCGRTLADSCDIIVKDIDGHLCAEVVRDCSVGHNLELSHAAEGSQPAS